MMFRTESEPYRLQKSLSFCVQSTFWRDGTFDRAGSHRGTPAPIAGTPASTRTGERAGTTPPKSPCKGPAQQPWRRIQWLSGVEHPHRALPCRGDGDETQCLHVPPRELGCLVKVADARFIHRHARILLYMACIGKHSALLNSCRVPGTRPSLISILRSVTFTQASRVCFPLLSSFGAKIRERSPAANHNDGLQGHSVAAPAVGACRGIPLHPCRHLPNGCWRPRDRTQDMLLL